MGPAQGRRKHGPLYNMGCKSSPHRVADLVCESLDRNNYLESCDVCE
jgi:hypothetical protein